MEEWPNFLSDIKNYSPESGDYFIISEISVDDYCEHILTPALISAEDLEKLNSYEIGYLVDGSGPHPAHTTGAYEPIFRIHSPNEANLEPFVLSWESANKTILWPDQGFLMTYGLFPRLISRTEEIIWDEPSAPDNDVIMVKPVSKFHWGNANLAQVKIKKDFIHDYSSLRNKIMIQLFYERKRVQRDSSINNYIDNKDDFEVKFRTHSIRIVKDYPDNNFVRIEVHGYRILAKPGKSPITEGRWDYGKLIWPGFDKPVTDEYARSLRPMDLVYVSDAVLENFEGIDQYEIHPESGSVSYGSQWSVSHCHRVGRNCIALELKKLYEGNSPDIVRLWHKYAVDPNNIDRTKRNIADLAKHLVDEYLMMGECLANILSEVLEKNIEIKDVVKFDKKQIEYYGWWSIKEIERITRHIPSNFNEDAFLERCKRLNILIVEGLNESLLRQCLTKIGIDPALIKGYGSLKLLELILEVSIISYKSGLNILKEGNEIIKRIDSENINDILSRLFGLYNLRQQAAHYQSKDGKKEFLKALESFGIKSTPIYGEVIEIVYEGIYETLNETNSIFSKICM